MVYNIINQVFMVCLDELFLFLKFVFKNNKDWEYRRFWWK